MKFFFTFYLVFNVLVHAVKDNNNSVFYEPSYIDIYHGAFSAKVHEWGIGIDSMVINIYDRFEDKNSSQKLDENRSQFGRDQNNSSSLLDLSKVRKVDDQNLSGVDNERYTQSLEEQLNEDSDNQEILEIDEFFLSRRLLEERDKSYVRVSFVENFHSLQKEEFKASVRARLYLGRSRKRLRLFIEDLDDASAKNIGSSDDKNTPSIGLERSTIARFGIKSKYSLGLRGFNPFARARYAYETNIGRWRCEPVQTFTYSAKDKFFELTELYLDTPTSENTFFRFVVDRGTESQTKGMRYDGFVQWFYQPRKYTGLSLSLGYNGNTKYQNRIIDSDPPVIEEEIRVYNYLFLLKWRESFWKKWLFYEIGPGLNYHEKHNYRPNYNIYFGIDLFFGHV